MDDANIYASFERMYEKIAWTKDTHVVAALSGGHDSVLLLSYLNQLRLELPFKLSALHIDHNQHKNSSQAALEIQSFVRSMSLECEIHTLNIPPLSSETVMRLHRYQKFAQSLKQDSWLMMGHHADDDFESWWLNMFRGCGIHNLRGIPSMRSHGHYTIYRPLLDYKKSQIIELHKKRQLPLWEDPSNNDTCIARNFLRHDVIPGIKEFFPSIELHISRLRQRLQSQQYWSEIAIDGVLDRASHGPVMSHELITRYSPEHRSELVYRWCWKLGMKPSLRLIELILRHLTHSVCYDDCDGVSVLTANGYTWIWKGILPCASNSYDHSFEFGENFDHVFGLFQCKSNINLVSSSLVSHSLVLPSGSHVSMKKRAQSLKIPKWLRAHWPVVQLSSGDCIDWWMPDHADIKLSKASPLGRCILSRYPFIASV